MSRLSASQLLAIARVFEVAVADLFDGYDRGAPAIRLRPRDLADARVNVTHSFLELEPKHQDALIRLTRALAAED